MWCPIEDVGGIKCCFTPICLWEARSDDHCGNATIEGLDVSLHKAILLLTIRRRILDLHSKLLKFLQENMGFVFRSTVCVKMLNLRIVRKLRFVNKINDLLGILRLLLDEIDMDCLRGCFDDDLVSPYTRESGYSQVSVICLYLAPKLW